MTDKDRLKEIARAFLIESQSDSEAVTVLTKNKQNNLAIEGKIGIWFCREA